MGTRCLGFWVGASWPQASGKGAVLQACPFLLQTRWPASPPWLPLPPFCPLLSHGGRGSYSLGAWGTQLRAFGDPWMPSVLKIRKTS
jgi:hypothetical protein